MRFLYTWCPNAELLQTPFTRNHVATVGELFHQDLSNVQICTEEGYTTVVYAL